MLDICVEKLNTGSWKWFNLDKVGADEIQEWLNGQEWEIVDIEGGNTLYRELRYMPFEKIKELNEMIEDEQHLQIAIEILKRGIVNNLEEALEYENYRLYNNCSSMEDVAYEVVEESGMLSDVPDHLSRYFDYSSYGRDLESNGTFVQLDNNTYLEIW